MGIGRLKPLGLLKSAGGAIGNSLSPVGVDFGVGALKVMQVDLSTAVPQLIAAACVDVPEELATQPAERLAWQADQLGRLMKNGFRGKRAVCSLPVGQTYCKSVQIQKTGGVNIAAVVQAGMAQQLQCDPNSIVCRYTDAGETERGNKEHEYTAVAVSRELVSHLMDTLRNAKLEPVGMHSVFEAGVSSFGLKESNTEPVLYIDMGAGSTSFAIAHGPTLAFARNLEHGGMHIDSFVAGQLKYSTADARRERLAATALVPGDRPKAAPEPVTDAPVKMARAIKHDIDLTEPIEIICDEVRLCLRYHASLFPSRKPERVVFMGGEAAHTALCTAIARQLRMPGQIADPMARVGRTGSEPTIGVDFTHAQPAWTVPLGLCLAKTDL